MPVERPPFPTGQRKPTVRCARLVLVTWKRMRRPSRLLPLPWKEASAEAVNAVAYATKYHCEWFWRGARQWAQD
jgi:hypothetical protein